MATDKQNEQEDSRIFDPQTGKYHEIPVSGSLGLLALGAVGLKAWRKIRLKQAQNKTGEKDDGKTTG